MCIQVSERGRAKEKNKKIVCIKYKKRNWKDQDRNILYFVTTTLCFIGIFIIKKNVAIAAS